MTIFLIVFLGICLLTAAWSLVLVRRAQDWRMAFLQIAVGIMPLYQAARLLKDKGIWSVSVWPQLDGLVELFISILWFVAIMILQLDASARNSAEIRQRLLEALGGHSHGRNVRELAPQPAGTASGQPASQAGETVQLTADQSKRFFEVIRGHRWEALFTTAFALGLGYDELLTLKWTDMDLLNGTLIVPPAEKPARGRIDGAAASLNTKRAMPIPAPWIARLQQHRALQEQLRQQAGDRWQETGLVFTTPGGRVLAKSNVLREFRKLLAKAGLPNVPPVTPDTTRMEIARAERRPFSLGK